MTDLPVFAENDLATQDERLYRLFFESSSDAFYVMPMAEDGRPQPFIDVNRRACEMLGYSREELLKATPLDIDSEASERLWRQAHRRLFTRGRDCHVRDHVTRDGRRVPVEVSSRLFYQGTQCFILAVARDISKRRDAEERLKRSREDLQALVDASQEFSALVRPDTTILRINQAGAARWNSTPDALKGHRIVDLSPGDIVEKREQVAREVVEQRQTIKFQDYRDGMWLENTISPIIDDAGEVSRFAIFSRDVTVAHLSRELDTLFNEIDRDVLGGTPVAHLVSFACEHLVRAFESPLVWFEEQGGRTATGIRTCHGRWLESSTTFPVLLPAISARGPANAEEGLRILKGSACPDGKLLCGGVANQPASLAVLEVKLPEGHLGLLAIASGFEHIFDSEAVSALVQHAGGRLQVAFEMAAEQRQLGLVKQALETAHNAVLIIDTDGRIAWSNEAFSRYSGFASGEIEYIHALGIQSVHMAASAEARRLGQNLFERVMASGEVWSGEAYSRRRDGSIYTVLQTITPVFNAHKQVTHLIAIQEDISKRKLDEEKIQYLAEHDALTGLHNRGFLLDHLQGLLADKRQRQSQDIGILYLDIDRFKEINDSYGHAVGDSLLTGFAGRLGQVIRQGDLVCRIGGDEFVLVLMDIREAREATFIATKLAASLVRPIICAGHSLAVTSSIGISLAPRDGETAELLLKKADSAMYEAKRKGRGRHCFWKSVKGSV